MKNVILASLAALGSTAAVAQNTTVVNQQGNAHETTVVQQGSSNTSVVNQNGRSTSNSAVINQSGSNNVATITQGNSSDKLSEPRNTVITSQVGEGETSVNQSNGGNTISVYQSGTPLDSPKKKATKKQPKN